MGSVAPFDVPDVTNWATFLARTVVGCNFRGCWMGPGNDCNFRFSAHRNDDVNLNAGTFVQATMQWGVGGTSTLMFEEWATANAAAVIATSGTPTRDCDAVGGNIRICGLATAIALNDAANKAYVDSKVNDMLDLHDPVKTVTNTAIVYGTGGYDSGAGTFIIEDVTATSQFTNPLPGSVEVGGVTLLIGERILLILADGGVVTAADGVYTLTGILLAQATFTRATDLAPPLDKGAFVLVDGSGADKEGNGYVLNADVAAATNDQPWILFSSQQLINYAAPIRKVGGNWTVATDDPSNEEKLPLVGGAGGVNGVAFFSSTVGLTGQAFAVHGSNITLEDATNLAINAVTSVTITAPTTTITAATALTLDATGGETKIYGNSNIFAKATGGTDPNTDYPTYAEAKALGVVAPTTSEYAIGTDELVGNGILFNTVNDFAGINSNEGVFYIAPHYDGSNTGATNSVTLDIIKFSDQGSGGLGTVIAQLIP